ncbi:MAG: hypothetical protein M1833_000770 [Piccolia ochrophora]|nr:MAG: hypothetical protein M1833_000770 [Piccolia ochrophora]
MREAIVHPDLHVELIESPIPKPAEDQVVVKVFVSGSNPKDWKIPSLRNIALNSGDDIAGIVHEVGEDVTEFKPGDRVAAFHEMGTPHGSFAEYAVSWDYTTFHIPRDISFEEAATIPLAAMTSAVGLYQRLGLPEPWRATTSPLPLIIYGASSAVGAFAVKLAMLSNIHPIIAVAGRASQFVQDLIDPEKGDAVVDYRGGSKSVVAGMKTALQNAGHSRADYALDAISEHGSYVNLCEVMNPIGNITLVLPGGSEKEIPVTMKKTNTMVGSVHNAVSPDSPEGKAGILTGSQEFGHVFFRFFGRMLALGYLIGHPYVVVPGGLSGVSQGLKNLKAGNASATKYVFRIANDEDGAGVAEDTAADEGIIQ